MFHNGPSTAQLNSEGLKVKPQRQGLENAGMPAVPHTVDFLGRVQQLTGRIGRTTGTAQC